MLDSAISDAYSRLEQANPKSLERSNVALEAFRVRLFEPGIRIGDCAIEHRIAVDLTDLIHDLIKSPSLQSAYFHEIAEFHLPSKKFLHHI
ncbi:MAG: hypothetical protein EOP83_29950 [Verrucomicrobiaceae bacterium]|nr:MAG: hypothetical protein EOP83_29950 [Verrucomicrobiaceae bacterium]